MAITKGRQKLNNGPVFFSSIAAFLNIVKMNVGIGVLSMPNAVANAGWGLGAGSMALLNIMTIHCMLLLVRFLIRNVPQSLFSKFGRSGQVRTDDMQAIRGTILGLCRLCRIPFQVCCSSDKVFKMWQVFLQLPIIYGKR